MIVPIWGQPAYFLARLRPQLKVEGEPPGEP